MTAKIERLTSEQEARFGEFVAKWTAIGLSTEPADRPRAEAAVLQMYKCGGLKPPARIVWCGSPLSMAITRAVLLNIKPDSVGSSVRASVGSSVRSSVRASVGASVWESVWESVGSSVRASVGASVRASVGASVWESVGASVGSSVRASVGASVWESVWESVGSSVRASVGASVRASVGASVWESVGSSVRASVGASVGSSVRASVGESVWESVYGQHDASWLAFYSYFHDALGLTEQTQRLDGLWEFAQAAGWAIPCHNVCFIAERHSTLHRDERGRLHCETGPAVAYPDGWMIHAIHGVRVSADVVERPETITLTAIDAERNSEIQRVMIERFGWDRYGAESGAQVVDHDERWGTLCRRGDMLFLRVVNRSPEPDGSFRNYVLPVDDRLRPIPDEGRDDWGEPQKLTALAAVASTFGMRAEEYRKAVGAES